MGLNMDAINPRRVVITGVGAVSPVGIGADRLFEAAVAGECGIKPLESEAAEAVNVHVAGTVTDFDGTEHGLTKKQARRWERFVQYAVVAADAAMTQAGFAKVVEEGTDGATEAGFILPEGTDANRFAVIFGSGIGGMEIFTNEAIKMHEKGAKRVNPLFIPTMMS